MQGELFLNRYRIEATLGESPGSVVYRALDEAGDGARVALKVLKTEGISRRLDDIIRFRAEADIVSRLSHPRVCEVREWGESGGLHYIVMEYVAGVSLRAFLDGGSPVGFGLVADIAIGVCEALDHVHRAGVIHRDLKPSNVIVSVDEASGALRDLKLIDFGLARVKMPGRGAGDGLAGTLLYIAPEQTGLLRKAVDERSDLYSLGAIIYEMLAGRLPFTADRFGALVHQHISQRPRPPSDIGREAPPILERIALKLLEKEQDDRYQSARGLRSDLERYRGGLEDFMLGTDDAATRLRYRTKLTGRERELGELKAALSGKGAFIFLEGEAGIGKSRLVEELKGSVSSRGMTFLEAKCFLSENKTPYGPFEEALNGYVKDFLCYTENEKASVREGLKDGLRSSGGVVLRLAPRMREVVGDARALVALEPDREHGRFIRLAGRFFLDLCGIENGLALFLDDLQWMDEGSFEILTEIAGGIAGHPLYVICAFRSGEISEGHGVSRLREACRAMGTPLLEMALGSLSPSAMDRLVSGLLFAREGETRGISEFVFRKSRGNPFFAAEILKQMISEKAIGQAGGSWEADASRLGSIDVPDDIVDILLKRISILSEKDAAALSCAAVIGKAFDIGLLFELERSAALGAGGANEDIVGIVERAKDLQLLEDDPQAKGSCLFVHDRIRDAFYARIGEEERRRLHGAVGAALERTLAAGDGRSVFDLAGHFIEAGDAEKTIEYALPAGLRAKDDYACAEAIRYLSIAKELLDARGGGRDPRWVRCVEALSDACLLAAESDEVIRLSSEAMPYLSGRIEKARAHMRISDAYLKKWDYRKCEEYARDGLALLGERYPTSRPAIVLGIAKELAVRAAHSLAPPGRPASAEDAERCKMIIRHYYSLGTIYVMSDLLAYARLIFRTLNLSESRIGDSRELAHALTAYATALTTLRLFGRAEACNRKALEMSARIGDAWAEGKCRQHFGFICQWKGEFRASLDHLERSHGIFDAINDIKETSFCLDLMKTSYIYLSDYENAKRVNGRYLAISRKCDDYYGIGDSLADSITIACETGDLAEARRCLRESEAIDERYKTSHADFRESVGAALLARAEGDPRGAMDRLEKARAEYEGSSLMEQYTCFVYSYLLDARLEESGAPGGGLPRGAALALGPLARKALRKARPWPTHYGAAQVVHAKYRAAAGAAKEAERWFKRGIALCERLGRKYDEAVGRYEYGNFLSSREREDEAETSWAKAYRIFAEIGAEPYRKRAKSLLRLRDEEGSPLGGIVAMTRARQLSSDILGLMREMIVSVDPEAMAGKVMAAVLEMTGAQRGCLIRRNPRTGDIEIIACAGAEEGAALFETISLSAVFGALEGGRRVISGDAEADPSMPMRGSIAENRIRGILCFPVEYSGSVVGVCYCDSRYPGLSATKEVVEALSLVAAQYILGFEGSRPGWKKGIMSIDEGRFESACAEYELTKREREILMSTVKGYSNREICERFEISRNTLRTHLKSIHGKTGAGDREDLVGLFASVKPAGEAGAEP